MYPETSKENYSKLKKVNQALYGNMTDISLEKRIYITASFVAFISCSIGFLWNFIIDLSLALNIVVGFILTAYAILYYFARFKNQYYNLILVVVSQIGLALTWISSGGSGGSSLPFFLISISPFIAVSKSKNHIYYLLITLLNIGLLFLLEKSQFNYLIIQYPDEITRDFDMIFSFIFSLILLYAFSHYLVESYRKENETVREQKKELELLNITKDKFFSIIAHDLRGPFNGIMGLSKLMSEDSIDMSKEELQGLASKLSSSANSTYGLLENLLNWAKMKQGHIEYQPKSIHLKSFASNHLEVMQDIADVKNLETANQIPEDIYVFADEYMLQTIIRNFILNAIKFTNSGGHVTIGARTIENNLIEISVTDNGVGMDKKTIDAIFSPGDQIRRRGTENEPSSGLGLLLCKEFIDQHNGIISIESEVEKGSTFKFTLAAATSMA